MKIPVRKFRYLQSLYKVQPSQPRFSAKDFSSSQKKRYGKASTNMRFGMEKPGTIDFEMPVFKVLDEEFKIPVAPMKQQKHDSYDTSAVRTAFGSSSKDRNLHKRDDSFLTSKQMSPFFGSSV